MWMFRPAGRNIHIQQEEKYLAAAGYSYLLHRFDTMKEKKHRKIAAIIPASISLLRAAPPGWRMP
jgi:hypothetical protein